MSGVLASSAGPRFSSGSAVAFPAWDQENEAAQSEQRPDRTMRLAQDTKRTHLIHRPAKDAFPGAVTLFGRGRAKPFAGFQAVREATAIHSTMAFERWVRM